MFLLIDECPAMIVVKDSSNKTILANNCYHKVVAKSQDSHLLEDIIHFDHATSYPVSVEAAFKDPADDSEITFAVHKFMPSHRACCLR